MNKQKQYKAAVIGCGNIGASISNYNKAVQPGTHAGAYLANKNTRLAALVEKNFERLNYLKFNFPNIPLYTDADKMFKEIKPDIVSITVPTSFHYENVLLASRYKCPVIFCEKPISFNLEEAKKMISACKMSDSVLLINHTRHFDPIIKKWSKKIKKGFLGRIYQGNAFYYNGLFNNGTHIIDLLRMFLGEPISVSMRYNQITSNDGKDQNIDGIIIFKNNAVVTLQSLSRNYGYFGFRLFGEKGMIDFDKLCYETAVRKKIKNQNYKGFYELSQDIVREGAPRSFMASAINHAVLYLKKRIKPISTGEDGLVVLKILLAIKLSADNNGKEVFIK